MPAVPKPEKRERTKARKDRAEAAVIRKVRAACFQRDGYCRLYLGMGPLVRGDQISPDIDGCRGLSHWCHLPPKTRAATLKMPPEERHGTAWTLMACKCHHDLLDGRQRPRIIVKFLTEAGANGPIAVEVAP